MEFIANNIILFIALVVLVVLIFNLETKSLFGKVQKLSCDELTKLLNNSKITLIDFRTAEEFNSGHIVTAKNLNLEDIEKLDTKSDNPFVAYASTDSDALESCIKIFKIRNTTSFLFRGWHKVMDRK